MLRRLSTLDFVIQFILFFLQRLLLLILISQRYESKTYLKKLKRLDWQIRQMNEIGFVNEHVTTHPT